MGRAVLTLVLACVVIARPGHAADERPQPAASGTTAAKPAPTAAGNDDLVRKAQLLGSDRWRRVVFEFETWLRQQPVYSPAQARGIRSDLDRRVAGMSSYEVDYLLDTLESKLRILDSPAARDSREWLGRYLAVMAERKRAEVLADVPNVLEMTTADLVAGLDRLKAKQTAVEESRRNSIRGREEFAAFLREQRAAVEAAREARSRVRVGDAALSPYRVPPVAEPPFADTGDGQPFPQVGPWGIFGGLNF